ncbi:hypothetical protein [Streptomyces sp. NPDC048155]|uniref:hypothetical protein n=1 Tax=Streptomyces sp. NPDC048155 TaxID=3154818 RepID=UPI0033CEDF6E
MFDQATEWVIVVGPSASFITGQSVHIDGGRLLHWDRRQPRREHHMIERVRAVPVTPDDTMLVIRRTRPGIPVY